MTQWEEQRCHACSITAIHAKAGAILLEELAKLRQEAKRGPLHPAQFKMVKVFAEQEFPGAQELLQKCLGDGLKENSVKGQEKNLPVNSPDAAKSFRSV